MTVQIQRAKQGDKEALSELLTPLRDVIYRLAYRMTGHPDDAEDLAQEASIRIMQKLSTYRGECSFTAWACRVTLRICLTAKSRPKAFMETLDDLEISDESTKPEKAAFQSAFEQNVHREIQRLPRAYREAVLLRLTEELSYAEIAETLHVPLNTALSRVHRGMKQLRECMEPWVSEETGR